MPRRKLPYRRSYVGTLPWLCIYTRMLISFFSIHGEISAINACTAVFAARNMTATQIFAAWADLSICKVLQETKRKSAKVMQTPMLSHAPCVLRRSAGQDSRNTSTARRSSITTTPAGVSSQCRATTSSSKLASYQATRPSCWARF
jgi:hypothetical protein